MKRDVSGKGNLLGIPSLLAQACVVAALPARLTGAGLPFGPDRAAAAAVTFSVSNMTKLPQYQLQMTVDSAYMVEVGVLRTGLCAGHPALKEILVSLVRVQLLARLTHVIDDDKTARYLESLMVEDATLHTAMSAGGTHLDAIGTKRRTPLQRHLEHSHANISVSPCSPPLPTLWRAALDTKKTV